MELEWTSATVGDAFDLVNGFAFKSKDFLEEGVPVIKIKNVKAGYFSEHEFSYVAPSFLDSRKEKVAQFDDLLISMSGNRHDGSPETWVGKVALFRKTAPYFINQRVGALRVKDPDSFDPRFMSYLLASWMYQSMFIAVATSSGGQANLSPGQILSAPIDFPSFDTQKAIAHILGTLDDKIELNRQMNATLESMAQALFKSWFVDFDPVIDNALAAGNPIPEPLQARAEARKVLRDKRKPLPEEISKQFPSSFVFTEEMSWVPEGWTLGPASTIAELNPEVWTAKTHPEKVRYIDLSNTKDGHISESTVYPFEDAPSRARRVLRLNDTIIGTVRPGNRSFAFIQETGLTGSTGFAVLRPREDKYRCFIYLSLTRTETIDWFAHVADGAAYPAIRPNVVGEHLVILPGEHIINLFDSLAYSWLESIGIKESGNQTLKKLRDTLLPKLLSGQLRIPEVENQLAEAL